MNDHFSVIEKKDPKKIHYVGISPNGSKSSQVWTPFNKFYKMAITPLLIDQIEKFQCLELSTAPKLSPGTLRSHVARVTCPET